jgi:hypothetical protein
MRPNLILLILLCCNGFCYSLQAQDSTVIDRIAGFPGRFFDKITRKTTSLEDQLTRNTEKYLQRLYRREQKLKRKLSKIDSTGAADLFRDSEQQYAKLTSKVVDNSPSTGGDRGEAYLPYVDSLKTSLSFLQQNNRLIPGGNEAQQKIKSSLSSVNSLQSKLQQSDQVKAFVQQRQQQIKQALNRYTNLPGSITNTYKDFSKDLYYYSAQIKEYRELLNNPDKLTQKALALLTRMDAFKAFMQQNSQLAGLFGVPANYGSAQSLAGLQTRAQTQALIQNQLASAGPNAQQMLQQNLQAAQAQLNTLKERINRLGSGSADMDVPDFKPNQQKIRSFRKRLEYGTNMQTTKSSYFFPTTTDLGLSVGYKINDNSTIGIGASYKVGWGKDIRHIDVSSQGASVRSFLDIKLKGSFFASGGYEYNYQPVAYLPGINPGDKVMPWQQSGLLGISKIVSLKSKLFKKTKLQLLWDFLSYQQTPKKQPVIFRVGYSIK